ncbi:MAG: trypsin-like peptidase domain-containing protein [Planctomycetes bacterium]|nr:trypsin-like peptidase domain-containing protein [Planctomycetota bacterium]MCB9905556.1 trypsin-like peptidase domain-containing protein [Planctomycetota bacterium]
MKLIAPVLLAMAAACANTTRYQVDSGGDVPRLENVFQTVHASVVTIRTVGQSMETDAYGRLASASGVGSGVLISEDGRILTASHVIQTADRVQVEFPDGTALPARVISSIPSADVAMIQLEKPIPKRATVAKLGDSNDVRVGEEVFVVGAPLGITHTLTVGYVSARRAVPLSPGSRQVVELFQTDAAINPGNSGGPMFNLRGEVIGIVSHIVSESGSSAGLGFAVTSNVARELMLNRNPFWSGMDGIVVAGDLAAALNVPDGRVGLLVQRVADGSPSDRLGLHGGSIPIEVSGQSILLGGDVVLEALGLSLSEPDFDASFLGAVQDLSEGDIVSVRVLRGGRQFVLSKTFSELRR